MNAHADDRLFNPLLTVDIFRFELPALHLGIFLRAFGIDTKSKFEVVAATFEVARELLAPLIIKASLDILPHLQRLVQHDPRTRIIFAGRDSFSLGYVVSTIDRPFSEKYCRSLYLTRAIVDAAISDLEAQGHSFVEIETFRKRAAGPARPAAWQELHDYLEASDLRLDDASGPVVIVDTGYKGSIQAMLAAMYPQVSFVGHYVFFSQSPDDPYPATKRGHLFDAGTGLAAGGRALRGPLPNDPELTFAHHEAIVAVEELLQGSQLSPSAMDPTGRPRLRRARRSEDPYEGLNPVCIAEEFTDPVMREAVLSFNVLAVSRLAARLATHVNPTAERWHPAAVESPWYQELSRRVETLRDQLRAWIAGSPADAVHPVLLRMLDSFVHRSDSKVVKAFSEQIRDLPIDRQAQAWAAFNACATDDAKARFTPPDIARTPPAPETNFAAVPPVLRRRAEAINGLLTAAPRLTLHEAHRVAMVLTDDPDAVRLAGATLAAASVSVDVYLDDYRTLFAAATEAQLRAVARLPMLVAAQLDERHRV
ncbi:hypothetical protein [Verrucosispora sp. ts21]|uniref:hypothetical protein n=1 Tax=Verrucosispora sp. ts21 TaxID=2069341 RepID=UPI0011AF2087|nr:hypothetical protein [Verrucosispora sp. ts21]